MEILGGLWLRTHLAQTRGEEKVPDLRRVAIAEVDRTAQRLPHLRLKPRLLLQLPLRRHDGRLARVAPALDYLPRILPHRVAVLPDQVHLKIWRQRDDCGRGARIDNAVDARSTIWAQDLVFAHTDPRITINHAAGDLLPPRAH